MVTNQRSFLYMVQQVTALIFIYCYLLLYFYLLYYFYLLQQN